MAIADYLRKLDELKNQLVANLNSMGVVADENEKLNTLVPKVLECKTKQNVEFVEGTDFTGNNNGSPGLMSYIESINIPDGTSIIGNYAFQNMGRLKNISIPNTVTSIGEYAFSYCGLTSITIPDSVTSIGTQAFFSCSSLANITIYDNVTSIGEYAFAHCKSLADIYYTGTSSQWSAITKWSGWNYNMGSNVSGGTVIHYNFIP